MSCLRRPTPGVLVVAAQARQHGDAVGCRDNRRRRVGRTDQVVFPVQDFEAGSDEPAQSYPEPRVQASIIFVPGMKSGGGPRGVPLDWRLMVSEGGVGVSRTVLKQLKPQPYFRRSSTSNASPSAAVAWNAT